MKDSKEKLIIFDTTLRDGEQSPGASMTCKEKVRIAKMLEKLNVDVIEAGFAVASQGDFDAIHAVASEVKDTTICSLARAYPKDIELAGLALKPARSNRIHTFIATSPIHMKYKLRMEPDNVVDIAVNAIKLARDKYTDDVEFSCEDASRSEFDFMCRIIEAAINAGARTINIPDTVGYAEPQLFGDQIKRLIENIPNSDKAIFSVHCHNDLGLAVANSLSAVRNGARQVECTINGLGERAGNAALEEIVMALKTRSDVFDLKTDIDSTFIVPTSKIVSSITGFPIQPNKAIVGANAFAHESGIHQDGVLKHRETYEIMSAESVGWKTNKLVLGKHSGRAAVKSRLEELGYEFDSQVSLDGIFNAFKSLADKKHEIFDEDLCALVTGINEAPEDLYQLVDLSAHCKMGDKPSAEVTLSFKGENITHSAIGDGPVDAAFKAVNNIVKHDASLQLYSVNNITQGTDSQGEVTVRLEQQGHICNGQGSDTDIVIASVKAYLNAINVLINGQTRVHPQKGV
jgi:2-isopropylmalate synthase